MSIDAINLALTLNDRDYRRALDSDRKALRDLGNTKFGGTKTSIRGATKDLKDMEAQAKRTSKAVGKGLLGGLERVSGALTKAGRVMRAGGLLAGGVGLAGKLGGMWMQSSARKKAGSLPPVPGSKEAARMERGKRWSAFGDKAMGVGSKLGFAGFAAQGVGEIAGLPGAISKLFGGSKSASAATAELTGNLGKLDSAAGKARKSSGGLGSLLGGGLKAGALAAAAAVATVGAGFVAIATSGLGMNSRLEQAKAQFEIFTGSALKADAIIDELRKRADITPFETQDYIEGGTALMSMAEGSKDKLMDLMKTAEMLTVLNPAEGLAGAAIAMKNALSGDFVSLQDRFNIAPATIRKHKEMGKTGQDLIRSVLSEMNITEKAMMGLGNTYQGRMSTLMSFIDNIRASLSTGLFAFLSEKMSGAIAWIDENQQWVMDTASGLGTMIGDVVTKVSSKVATAWNWISGIGKTVYEFISGLPAKIAEAFQSGDLMSHWGKLLGHILNVTWNYIHFLGTQLWNAIVNGVPLLVTIVGKLVVDGLRDALGDKVSNFLGLEDLSKTLGDASSGGAMVMKENFSKNFDEFLANQKHSMSGLGKEIAATGKTLGWDEAQQRAAGSSLPGAGLLEGARQMGESARLAKEREIAGVRWDSPASAAPSGAGGGRPAIDDKTLQAQENWNARAQGRPARNLKAHNNFNQAQGGSNAGSGRVNQRVAQMQTMGLPQQMAAHNAALDLRRKQLGLEVRVTSMDGTISPLSR